MITIIASFELKPECVEEFLAQAEECIAGSRSEEGNISYDLYVSRENSCKYFFVENWKDEEAIQSHNATPHFQKFSGAFAPMLAGAPTVELLEKAR